MYLFGCRYAGFIYIYLGAGTLGSYVVIWVQIGWVHMYLFGCRYAGFICIYLGADTLGSYVFIWVQVRWVHMYLFGCRYAGFICIYLGADTLGSYVNAPKQICALEARTKKLTKLWQTFKCGYNWMILKVSRIFFFVLLARGSVLER